MRKLIKWMLEKNPAQRPSAHECLGHAAFDAIERPNAALPDRVLQNIIHSINYNWMPFQKQIMKDLAGLYHEKHELISALFLTVDGAKKGYITRQDLGEYLGQQEQHKLSSIEI